MKRISLRHVPLFWIGLLPVMLLLWAWADSLHQVTCWTYCRDGQRATAMTLRDSILEVGSFAITPLPGHEREAVLSGRNFDRTGSWGRWTREPGVNFGDYHWFPPPDDETVRYPLSNGHVQFGSIRIIPLWLIFAVWLPLWLGLAEWQSWRQERKHRAAEQAMMSDGKS